MRVLVIGVGYWGSKLVERFINLLGYDNVHVNDINPDPVLFLQKELSVTGWGLAGLENPLASELLDACVIATPPDSHYEIAKQCLEAGKHVLVEKPMALNVAHARELIELAQEKQLTLMTDDTFLYSVAFSLLCPPAGQSLARLHTIFSGDLGLAWQGPREGTPEHGILWELGPHPVSIMLRVMECPPSEYYVLSHQLEPRRAYLRYYFPSGYSATIALNWNTPIRKRQVFLREEHQMRLLDFDAEPETPDPLTNMCRAFIKRAQADKPWIDYHALEVVEVLEATSESSTD